MDTYTQMNTQMHIRYAQENKMKWMIEEKDETSSYDRGEKGKKVENGEWM